MTNNNQSTKTDFSSTNKDVKSNTNEQVWEKTKMILGCFTDEPFFEYCKAMEEIRVKKAHP